MKWEEAFPDGIPWEGLTDENCSPTQVDLLPESDALFSDDGVYRYTLWRHWDQCKPIVLFVMLNPSTADATKNDPTVERCERFAKRWGYGSLVVVNIFALRSTDPKALYTHHEPVGPSNDWHILDLAEDADLVVCAWGNHGGERAAFVKKMLTHSGCELHCLGINKTGEPVHPLYQPNSATPIPLIHEKRDDDKT